MLISEAFAQAAPAAQPGADLMSLLPLIAVFAVFYLLLIRPQAKRAKEQKLMIEALQKGDEVTTTGGELGRVVKVSGNYIILQIAENVQVVMQKSAKAALEPTSGSPGYRIGLKDASSSPFFPFVSHPRHEPLPLLEIRDHRDFDTARTALYTAEFLWRIPGSADFALTHRRKGGHHVAATCREHAEESRPGQ